MRRRDYWGIVGGLLALAFLDLGVWMIGHLGKVGSPRHAQALLVGFSGAQVIILGIIGLIAGLVAVLGGNVG